MKRSVLAILAVAVPASVAIALSLASRDVTASSKPSPAADHEALVKRGEHLVATSGCNDCHTPLKMGANGPEPDMSRMLSGHPDAMQMPPPPKPEGPWIAAVGATNTAWAGPWGISYTANLTPDKDTGLGTWNLETFSRTIRTGRHLGMGRPILPPMPIPAYKNFTDDELAAVFAYLQSIPAIKNHVPDAVVAPPPPPAKG